MKKFSLAIATSLLLCSSIAAQADDDNTEMRRLVRNERVTAPLASQDAAKKQTDHIRLMRPQFGKKNLRPRSPIFVKAGAVKRRADAFAQ